jgi:SOS-response transcriptional repressor LexA
VMNPLTEKQATILNHIKEFIHSHSYPPSIPELCELTGLRSTSTIKLHIDALKRKKYITFIPGKRRTISVLDIA